MITGVCQHDARALTRITLTDEAAAVLACWKRATWQECYGHATGQTALADGEAQDILEACALAVEAFGIDERHPISGAFHAVIYAEGNGECVHATYVGRELGGDRYYLAG